MPADRDFLPRRDMVMIELTAISVIGSFAPVICDAKTGDMTKLPAHYLIDIE